MRSALIGEQNEKQMLHFDVKVKHPKFQLVGKFKHNHGFSANLELHQRLIAR